MRKIFVLSLLVMFCAGAAVGEVFKMVHIAGAVSHEFAKDKASGQALWADKVKAEKITYGQKPFLVVTDNGSGVYGKDKTFKAWESTAYYKFVGTTAIPNQTKIVFKNANGKVIQTIEKMYDPDQKIVVVKINGKEERRYVYQPDLIDKELLGTALANYPFEEKRDYLFHLITNEPAIYPMTIKYIGQENLMVGGKSIPCYKIQMIPDLGALNIFGAFVPKTYFWYTADDQREFMRYEGLESGLGTPYIVIEKKI